uniref:Rho guanine nucleotide exchange factor 12 n=1 Tax=Oreochromis niloticus TaxID=8128 RepID=A0A669CAD3_ORENI
CYSVSSCRFPKKANRTSSILSKDHPPDKKPKSEKNSIPSNEFDPTGLVQRCVIIQKDENGFGLTVSGDNPVFVQLVKEDGAAMRAGVQTGDRIIKVNGTHVAHSNHTEVVKLIKSGSYVALTVLGRPPGLAQIPLPEAEPDMSLSPNSPAPQRPCSPQDSILPIQQPWAMKEEYSRNPSPKLLKDIQEAEKHIPQLQGQLPKAIGTTQVVTITCPKTWDIWGQVSNGNIQGGVVGFFFFLCRTFRDCISRVFRPSSPESLCPREFSCPSPKTTPRNSYNSFHFPETEDTTDLDALSPTTVSSPSSSRLVSQIIGAEDDYFDSDQEQTNGQCNSFNSIELLKSRPAHLAAFLYHVISQFDPAPVLCYLYADLYKQTNSKETRRVFMDLHNFFIDRGANLKVGVPESVSADLGKYFIHSFYRRRTELIPEEINRQHVQTLQDSLLPDIQKNLEDFRQKRSMGLTVAEAELGRLDQERVRDRGTLERERSYAENIIAKIDDILTTMQYVIYTYMKHLGVRVKEPRSLESKRLRISEKLTLLYHCRLEGLGAADIQSEDDQGTDSECDPPNWQHLVRPEVLAGLRPHEIKRQEVIHELFYTERAHVRMLKVLDNVFYQKLTKDSILPPADTKNIFSNLEEVLQLHDQMAAVRKRNDSSVIDQIGDDLLSWFSGGEEEKIKQAVGTFCSNQPFALELIKTKQKKDSRFTSFILEAESNRQCRRLQLKDIIPVEMLRLTKYPLLLDNIVKYTDNAEEKEKVKQAADCCRKILSHVNQAVKESEDKQRLEDYQRRLDLSSLKQTDNPMILELKNLDLTKKTMVHEGPLSWKVNRDKTIELYTLLLEDILVLLQKQDERLILKCHSKNLAGTADTKHIFSPIIKLSTVLVRSVATDNKSFFVLSMSENGAQIYELMAPTVSDQRTWQRLITQRAEAMKVKPHSVIPLPQTVGERDGVEIITTGVSRLSRDTDRTSTGSTQSTDKESSPVCRSALQTSLPGSNPFEGVKTEEEEEGFVDPELSYPVAEDCRGASFNMFPSRADEALKTLAALKQVLVTQLMSQEAAEQTKRSTGARLLRTTSLRTPIDSRARVTVHNGSEKTGSQTDDLAQDLGSGDTGFFDSTDDYAAYLVLEGYGGPGESSTDDDILATTTGKQLSTSQGCAADSGINLRFSSTSQAGSLSSFSRQVLSHLRNLQANLNYLKEVEAKYNSLIQQRPERSAADTDGNKGISLHAQR